MEWRVRESWDLEEQNADVDQSEGRERWFLCSFSHSVSSCDWSAFPLNYSRRKESMGYRPVCQLETGVCGLIPMCPWANLAYLFCLTVSQYHIVLIFFFFPQWGAGGPTVHGLWDFSSQTRDWTQTMTVKVLNPNHWTTKELFHCLHLQNEMITVPCRVVMGIK